ncbi:hypothetical protein [Burkholderia humptydooensis]|uniref:hypothetical protein n=1 Tax=Burkholderia humptydooensis TaxID=430531 RepID=UPI0010FD4D52|nr:hypothetical protein [Burkholderia humptydooensis]
MMNGFESKGADFNLDYADINNERYDVALLPQVLEHLSIDSRRIDGIKVILRGGGIFAIAAPHFGSVFR